MRIDDLNWGRLNLISAVDQVDGQRSWNVEFQHGGRQVRVSCRALPELCVPHGVDNDVSSALIDLLDSSGLPEDGLVTVSASALMSLAGFHRNGRYWAMLRESLDRLHTTSFEVSGGWRDHPNRRWITAKFHFIENLEYTHQGESGSFDERTMIQLQLAKPLVASMLSGYTKPLNMSFMHSLSRPRTRILFRLLDAMRYDPENPEATVDALDVGLVEWADQCKISSVRPDTVRRALQSPHEELIRRGYLQAVTISGRGRNQRLFYEFTPDFSSINPVLLTRLRRHGVTDGVARGLARTYALAVLNTRIDLFEALVRNGQLTPKKSAAAALVHLIKNPDQYSAETLPLRPVPAPARRVSKSDPAPSPSVSELLTTMSPEERGAHLIRQLNLLLRGKLTTLELDALHTKAVNGELDVAEVCAAVLKAKTANQVPALLAHLRASVHQAELF
ncbi:replication initiator protein A [Deinococcus sonorensis]|uniref:Replication initiator protein A n=2 Tax=Deinococcus sonorensis TaxID=309891 RepID=A0AAU7U576_9DEIO